jgi:hypothetical protein
MRLQYPAMGGSAGSRTYRPVFPVSADNRASEPMRTLHRESAGPGRPLLELYLEAPSRGEPAVDRGSFTFPPPW